MSDTAIPESPAVQETRLPVMTDDCVEAVDAALSEARSYANRYLNSEAKDADDADENREIGRHYQRHAKALELVAANIRSQVANDGVWVSREKLKAIRSILEGGDSDGMKCTRAKIHLAGLLSGKGDRV